MRFTATSSLLFAVVCLLPACGGQAVDVGSNTEAGTSAGGSSSGSSAGTFTSSSGAGGSGSVGGSSAPGGGSAPVGSGPLTGPVWTDPEECATDGGLPYEGTWTGYAQGEGSDYDFTLVLGGSSEAPCGTLTFGEPQSYGEASDAGVPYPANESSFKRIDRAPDFSYRLLAADATGSRLQFRVAYAETYASWCGLQYAYPQPSSDDYSCLPSYGEGALVNGDECRAVGPGSDGHVYSCAHFDACLGAVDPPCACTEEGCAANIDSSGEHFDLRFEATEASGEMNDKLVFLEKQ